MGTIFLVLSVLNAVDCISVFLIVCLDLPVWNIQIREMKYLYHIRYYDPNTFEKKELRILEDLSADWQEIGDILGFRPPEMKAIEAKKTPIREIFIKWIQNADMTDRRFPINWTGVYNILEATKHGTTSNDLKDAIETSCSDLHENFGEVLLENHVMLN